MSMHRAPLSALILVFSLLPVLAGAQRPLSITDAYGYRVADSVTASGECAHAPVTLDAGAVDLMLADLDDGSAALNLSLPLPFYGSPQADWRVSANGYLAASMGDMVDDGSDFSGDCPLPAIADNPSATMARIHALHADLELDAMARIRTQFFTLCPRASTLGDAEACTVVEWSGVRRIGTGVAGPRASFQAVLYHASGEVALQYMSVPVGFVPRATLGLQSADLSSGITASCAVPPPVSGQTVCMFDESQGAPTYTITTAATPLAGGTTAGGGVYPQGAVVTVTATANPGFGFVNWSENGTVQSLLADYQFDAGVDRNLLATFELRADSIFANGFESGVAP